MAVKPPPGLYVFIGGGLGVLGRAILGSIFPDPGAAIPATTLAINLSGSFALGLLLRILALRGPDRGRIRAVRLGVGTGILGGYTTFSAFALQNITLAREGQVLLAAGYLTLSLVGGFAAAWAGTELAKKVGSRP